MKVIKWSLILPLSCTKDLLLQSDGVPGSPVIEISITMYTALVRRRIRDERLRHEITQVGVRSKTDICISYIDGIADPDLVDIIRKELGLK